jgi:small subunit ribosomal protein S6e
MIGYCIIRRPFYEKRIAQEVKADFLGEEWKGYVLRITGGNDKDGFAMKQGVLTNGRVKLLLSKGHTNFRPRRKGHRKRKSVHGCIVDESLSVICLIVVKKGDNEIPGLTDRTIPRRLGPKRVGKIRKLFNLSKEDDVRQYIIHRPLPLKEGKKQQYKAPKIQRLMTPLKLQRKRHRRSLRQRWGEKSRREASDYKKMLAQRMKEAREKHQMAKRRLSSKRSSTSST